MWFFKFDDVFYLVLLEVGVVIGEVVWIGKKEDYYKKFFILRVCVLG